MKMRKGIKTIGDSMTFLFEELGIDKKVKSYRVIELWPQIVGEKIDKISKPDRVFENVLYVKVKSMPWRTELLFQKAKILSIIEQIIGIDVINDIRFI